MCSGPRRSRLIGSDVVRKHSDWAFLCFHNLRLPMMESRLTLDGRIFGVIGRQKEINRL